MGGGPVRRHPGTRHLPRSPGDQRLRRRIARPACRGPRLASLLAGGGEGELDKLEVNAYHHQGVLAADLAPGLRASAWADSPAGPLIEGLEGAEGPFLFGIQCHPERTESTPPAFERLFAAFVDAARARATSARGSAVSRP